MNIKKYVVSDMKEGLRQIKEELGPDAVILTTRKVTKQSGLGLFPKEMIEVTATADYNKNDMRNKQKAAAKTTTTPKSVPLPENPEPNILSDDDAYLESLLKSMKDSDVTVSDTIAANDSDLFEVIPRVGADSEKQLTEIITMLGLDKISSLVDDVGEIKKQLADMKNSLNEPSNINLDFSQNLKDFYTILSKNGMDEILIYRLLKTVEKKLPDSPGKAMIRGIITQGLIDTIPVESDYVTALNKKVTAFIGPTGVGKTTTIAKVAAQLVLRYSQRVCLITADNFRIGAVEQLQTYADIVSLPLYVAYGPEELKKLLDEYMQDYDYILLDTTGRSPYDNDKLNSLAGYLEASPSIVPVLVLSLAANHVELGEMFDKYSNLNPAYLVFTKLDETRYFGPLANVPMRKKTPLLLLSTGQGVPDDLEVPDGKKIAKKLLQEIPALWKES